MAKITLTFEDSPDGVIFTGYGIPIQSDGDERTDAQRLVLLIKHHLVEHYAGQKFWRGGVMPAEIND